MKCCEDEILDNYFKMINVPNNVLTIIDSLANIIPHKVVYDPGDPFFDTTGCFACSFGTLNAYGTKVSQLRNAFNALAHAGCPDTVPNFMHYMDSCYVKCYYNYISMPMYSPKLCYLNCVTERELRHAHELKDKME